MKRRALAALAVLLAAIGLRGCSWRADPSRRLDATGLKYVAEERIENQAAADDSAGREQRAAHLEGFTRELPVVDGRIELTLEEAVRRTLLHSLDIQVASYSPAIAETDVVAASSVFDPVYFLEGSLLNTDQPTTAFVAFTGGSIQEDRRAASTGIRKTFPTGGSITISENLDYLRTTSGVAEPLTYSTNFMVELTQPLLRGMGLDANKAQIYIASHNREASVEEFRAKVMDVLAELESVYWDLAFAVRDVDVRRRSLELARETYRKEQRLAEEQMTPPLEVARAHAAVTAREAELIRARNRVRNLSDRLKSIMNDPELDLNEKVTLVPADRSQIPMPEIDRDRAVVTALSERPALRQLRSRIRAIEADRRLKRNELLPRLDASFMWRRNSLDTRSGDAFKDQGTGRYTDYEVGLTLEVPLGNRQAKAEHRRAALEYEQAARELENMTQDVVLEVNTAIREVRTTLEEISATRDARIAARETLEGEQARYDVGEVTNEELLRAQRDYEEAQRNELEAITRFNVAITELERAKGALLHYNNVHVLPKAYQPSAD